MPSRLTKSMSGAVVAIAIVAFAALQSRQEPAFAAPIRGFVLAGAPDAEDMLYNEGPSILLRSHSHRAASADWMKFETDGCGTLERVESSRSMLTQSALDEGVDDFDQDPLDSGRTLFGQWLSEHAKAVLNDIPDKSCDDSVFDGGDEDTFEIA